MHSRRNISTVLGPLSWTCRLNIKRRSSSQFWSPGELAGLAIHLFTQSTLVKCSLQCVKGCIGSCRCKKKGSSILVGDLCGGCWGRRRPKGHNAEEESLGLRTGPEHLLLTPRDLAVRQAGIAVSRADRKRDVAGTM